MRRYRIAVMDTSTYMILLLMLTTIILLVLTISTAANLFDMPQKLISVSPQGERCHAVLVVKNDGNEKYEPCSWLTGFIGTYRRVWVSPSWQPPKPLRRGRSV